jgi:hypothetical protein
VGMGLLLSLACLDKLFHVKAHKDRSIMKVEIAVKTLMALLRLSTLFLYFSDILLSSRSDASISISSSDSDIMIGSISTVSSSFFKLDLLDRMFNQFLRTFVL